MHIQKKAGTWNGLVMVINGQINEAGVVTPSEVTTSIIRLDIEDAHNIFDQFIELGSAELNSVVVDIAGKDYTFNKEMASELLRVISVACNDQEGIYADEEYLPIEQWTEEYLLAL